MIIRNLSGLAASFPGEILFRRGCLLVALSDLLGQDGLDELPFIFFPNLP